MVFELKNVDLSDRAELANLIIRSNLADGYAQCLWPNISTEERISGTYARFANSLVAEGAWLMKIVEDGKTISYAHWELPKSLWRSLIADSPLSKISAEDRLKFKREAAAANDDDDWPIGVRREVGDFVSPGMRAARAKAEKSLPTGEHIVLNQLKTLPEHQRRGAASALLEWGCKLADEHSMAIWLEATPFGLGLYEKQGFRRLEESAHDLSRFGGPDRYAWWFMQRDSKSE